VAHDAVPLAVARIYLQQLLYNNVAAVRHSPWRGTSVQNVSFENNKPVFAPYLDHYPFNFYTVLQEVEALPAMLSDALRQWVEMTLQS
jgi:hypothetical protein